jgi:hypothetical protein
LAQSAVSCFVVFSGLEALLAGFMLVTHPASEHANRESHPFQAWLAQAEEIRTRRDAGEIDISS